MSHHSMRALVWSFAVLILFGGGLVAAGPSSADGPVTVTWPEMTSFNADETDYVIDVQSAGDRTLYLLYMDPNEGNVSFDQLAGPGSQVVDFPVDDSGGRRQFYLFDCAPAGYPNDCNWAGVSPELTVTRDQHPLPELPNASVEWPEETEFNPEVTDYTPDVTWDGTGSLFLIAGSDDGQQLVMREITSSGVQHIVFPDRPQTGGWQMYVVKCPGRVLEAPICDGVGVAPPLSVWNSLKVDLDNLPAIGPNLPIGIAVHPAGIDTVDAHWQILNGDTVLSEGDFTGVPAAGPLPALGPQPSLVNGRQYSLRVTARGAVAPYGSLTGTSDAMVFRWDTDPGNLPVAVGRPGAHGDLAEVASTFYPVQDGYFDALRFLVQSSDAGSIDVRVTDSEGTEVFAGEDHVRDDGVYVDWTGLGSDDSPLPEGSYTATIKTTDSVGNPKVSTTTVDISHQRAVLATWQQTFDAAATPVSSLRENCGWFKKPARQDWPGSVGFYTAATCQGAPSSRVKANYAVVAPPSVTGQYGKARVIIRGGASNRMPTSHLNFGFFTATGGNDLTGQSRFDGDIARHSSAWVDDTVQDDHGHLAVKWRLWTGQGSRYDVKTITVQVERYVLQ